MNVGYARVSTSSQSLENQIEQLKAAGCEKIFSEKRSGKNASDREQFKIMKNFIREGDVLFVTKLDRLARSVIDLHEFAKYLENKDVNLKVLNQNIDTTSPAGRLLFTIDDASTNQTDVFLSALQEKFPNDHLVIVWDRAPFHRSQSLKRKHMTLVSLPSYSPQPNPVERYFGEMRKVTANQIFRDGMEALSKIVEQGILTLSKNIEAMKTLTGYPWILEQWQIIANWMIVRI